MRKRKLAMVYLTALALGISSLSLTACGGKDDAAAESTEQAVDPITGQPIVETQAPTEAETEEETTTAAPTQEFKVEIKETEAERETSDFTPVESSDGRWQKGKNGSWTFILNSTNEPAKEVAVDIEGVIYYFDKEGNMQNEGWAKDTSGTWRYVKDGKYKTGWIQGKYYSDENGMKTGLCEIEGAKYLMGDDGVAVEGWKEVAGKWYYATKGKLSLGVCSLEDATYGFDTDGVMQTGECSIAGKKYIFGEDGKALTGLIDTEKGKVYCDDGEAQTGKVEVNGSILKFDSNGYMESNLFVNGVYINADGSADAKKRVTNIGAFANKDGIDEVMNGLPAKLVDEMFTQNGWKLIYDSTAKGSLEEIEGSGSVSFNNKFLKFHNLDTVGHRLGHYVNFVANGASGIKELREAEFANLGWDEYFGKSDNEYFSEACGKILVGEFDKSKAPKTYDYIYNILNSSYEFNGVKETVKPAESKAEEKVDEKADEKADVEEKTDIKKDTESKKETEASKTVEETKVEKK